MVTGPISEPTIGKQLFCRRQNFGTVDAARLSQMLRDMADFVDMQELDDIWSIQIESNDDSQEWTAGVYIGGLVHPMVKGRTLYYPEDLP